MIKRFFTSPLATIARLTLVIPNPHRTLTGVKTTALRLLNLTLQTTKNEKKLRNPIRQPKKTNHQRTTRIRRKINRIPVMKGIRQMTEPADHRRKKSLKQAMGRKISPILGIHLAKMILATNPIRMGRMNKKTNQETQVILGTILLRVPKTAARRNRIPREQRVARPNRMQSKNQPMVEAAVAKPMKMAVTQPTNMMVPVRNSNQATQTRLAMRPTRGLVTIQATTPSVNRLRKREMKT